MQLFSLIRYNFLYTEGFRTRVRVKILCTLRLRLEKTPLLIMVEIWDSRAVGTEGTNFSL